MVVVPRRSPLRRALVLVACAGALPLLASACKKPEPAVVDAGPPPPVVDAAPVALAPLDDDGGLDAGADASDAAPKHHGTGLSTNQLRAKQCCNELRKTAKEMGASPEANIMLGFAAQCDAVAAQMGPTAGGQAPEFGPLRQMLKGRNIPAVCQGL